MRKNSGPGWKLTQMSSQSQPGSEDGALRAGHIVRTQVIGSPISQSLSPVLLGAAGLGIKCERIEIHSGELHDHMASLEAAGIAGLSVTMPLKQEAFSVCDTVDDLARQVGAINTIVFRASPGASDSCITTGYNTDVAGIVAAVREQCGASSQFGQGAILGSGATASSALAALRELGVKRVTVCARRSGGEDTVFAAAKRFGISLDYCPLELAAELIGNGRLVISTLPFGVADVIAAAINAERMDCSKVTVLDAAYVPYPSLLTQAVLDHGGMSVPGYEMLIHQGLAQAQLFTGQEPNADAAHQAVTAALGC